MANRLWRWHFGRGIVPSTDNFGRLGERPTNQPLLDWLAVQFVEKQWSMKEMHRLMMLSNTYQMSTKFDARAAEVDPENTLLWRANRQRLEAEPIRDAVMAVSGDLDTSMGGTLLTYKDRQYASDTEKRGSVDYDRNRRAVYIPVVRSSMYEVFQAFDMPDPATSSGDRAATVVAPQALFMMNGTVVLKHTRHHGRAVVEAHGSGRCRASSRCLRTGAGASAFGERSGWRVEFHRSRGSGDGGAEDGSGGKAHFCLAELLQGAVVIQRIYILELRLRA